VRSRRSPSRWAIDRAPRRAVRRRAGARPPARLRPRLSPGLLSACPRSLREIDPARRSAPLARGAGRRHRSSIAAASSAPPCARKIASSHSTSRSAIGSRSTRRRSGAARGRQASPAGASRLAHLAAQAWARATTIEVDINGDTLDVFRPIRGGA
jgi:hypothetical protein